MSHVMLNTLVRNAHIASQATNITCSTSATAKTATTTKPTSGSGSVVLGSVMNYLKVHPWAASTITPTIRVIGWSYCIDTRLWVPHSIAEVGVTTLTGTNVSINGTNLQAASVLAKNAGDAKIFNPATSDTDAYFVVDAQGFELIELHFRAGSAAAANATLGEM